MVNEISLEDIKRELMEVNGINPSNVKRKMRVVPVKDTNSEQVGTIYFSLEGTPPKGFAVYYCCTHQPSVVYCYNTDGSLKEKINGKINDVPEEIKKI